MSKIQKLIEINIQYLAQASNGEYSTTYKEVNSDLDFKDRQNRIPMVEIVNRMIELRESNQLPGIQSGNWKGYIRINYDEGYPCVINPIDLATTPKVVTHNAKFEYFKPSGKYYSEASEEIVVLENNEVIDKFELSKLISDMRNNRQLPGLVNNYWNGSIFVTINGLVSLLLHPFQEF